MYNNIVHVHVHYNKIIYTLLEDNQAMIFVQSNSLIYLYNIIIMCVLRYIVITCVHTVIYKWQYFMFAPF